MKNLAQVLGGGGGGGEVGGEEVVPERRKSAIEMLITKEVDVVRRKSVMAKVTPEGMKEGGRKVDAQEFFREMKLQGAM